MTLDDFLRTGIVRPGPTCNTCQLDNVEAINTDLRRFANLRETKQTFLAWHTFWRVHMKREHQYKLTAPALFRHLEDCLGIPKA